MLHFFFFFVMCNVLFCRSLKSFELVTFQYVSWTLASNFPFTFNPHGQYIYISYIRTDLIIIIIMISIEIFMNICWTLTLVQFWRNKLHSKSIKNRFSKMRQYFSQSKMNDHRTEFTVTKMYIGILVWCEWRIVNILIALVFCLFVCFYSLYRCEIRFVVIVFVCIKAAKLDFAQLQYFQS